MNGFEKTTIWGKFTKLANDLQAVNMGQGFPDWQPATFFVDSLQKRISSGFHQYQRSYGNPTLTEIIAKTYSPIFQRNINHLSEVCVSNGGVSLLYNAITALAEKDDEVIVIEPFYDCYLPQSNFCGAKVVATSMLAPKSRDIKEYADLSKANNYKDEWKIDFEDLARKVNKRTKILVLNSPNNPTGKILSESELQKIADIISPYPDIVVISDEVYERMIFDDWKELPRFANIKNMWERTITIMSAGKTFSATGMRIGWALGAPKLINALHTVHQYNSFCLYEPLQLAVADCLRLANEPYQGEKDYYIWLRKHYQKQRNLLVESMAKMNHGLKFWLPEGGYFLICDIGDKKVEKKYSFDDDAGPSSLTKDFSYVLNLAHEKKIVTIPVSAFYTKENEKFGENYIRIAFCKKDETMQKAIDILKNI